VLPIRLQAKLDSLRLDIMYINVPNNQGVVGTDGLLNPMLLTIFVLNDWLTSCSETGNRSRILI